MSTPQSSGPDRTRVRHVDVTRENTGAVVVLYGPDDGSRDCIRAVHQQVARVWLVDNSPERSGVAEWALGLSGVTLLHEGQNIGLGAAYDLAFEAAEAAGLTWMVTLDQDTVLDADYLAEMARGVSEWEASRQSSGRPPLGVAGPMFRNPRALPGEAHTAASELETTMVVSSGALMPVSTWRSVGGFHPGLIVDYVDTEMCLRVRAAGYAVIQLPAVLMTHGMGYTAEHRVLGLRRRSSNYPATRHYYMNRNLVLTARSAGGWRWGLAEQARRLRFIALTLAVEPQRTAKAAAMLRGLRDGFMGRQGVLGQHAQLRGTDPLPHRSDDEARPWVGVTVVAYRSSREIRACVSSCLLDPQVRSVVVVDNSRDPATKEALDGLGDTRVTYIPSDNVGFAAGSNLAVSHLPDVDWVAYVNPDVVLHRPVSELAAMGRRLGASLVSANVPTSGAPHLLTTRPHVTLGREIAAAALGSRVYAVPRSRLAPGRAHPAGQVLGALMLMPRGEVDALGGMDERFELYYEDVDLCARAASRGGCWFVAEDWGTHIGGSSADGAPSIAYVAGPVSRIRYLRKTRPGLLTEVVVPLIAAVDLAARTVTRSREGGQIRRRRFGAQLHEWLRPGRTKVLR